MNKEDLNANIGLYRSLDLIHDSRISVFTKAGSNAILFSLIVVGYFISGQQILFPYKSTKLYIFQIVLTFLLIMVYSFLHDLIHFIAGKLMHVKLELKFKYLFPYIKYTNDIEKKKNYYFTILAPFVLFLIILIPLQIIISIIAHDWFWLIFIIIIQNFVVSIDDLAYVIYTMKYKNTYLQISETNINIYFDKKLFKMLREKEKRKISQKIAQDELKYNEKKAKKILIDENIDQDIEDLKKLDK